MSLTITLNPATLDALSAEAAARNATCEQVVCEVLEDRYAEPKSVDPEYDAWYRAKVEEGLEDIRRGDVYSNDEVKQDMAERRARLLSRIAGE